MYTSEQIELFDKVFNYYVDFEINKTEKINPSDTVFSEMFGIDRELAKFAINNVLEIGNQLEILISEKSGYGEYGLVRMDSTLSINFQKQGGFTKYFSDIAKSTDKDQTITIDNNYGQVKQVGNNSNANNKSFILPKEQESKKSFFKRFINNNWIIAIGSTVIGGLILTYLISIL